MGVNQNAPTRAPGNWKPNQTPVIPAWSTEDAYFIFPHAPSSCDERLEDEETLLCIADKLAEVADNIGTVEWKNPEFASHPAVLGAIPQGWWMFGPQATADKFVARDLAIQVLGIIPRMSSEGFDNTSCAAHYAEAGDPAVAHSQQDLIYGLPYGVSNLKPLYPPSQAVVGSPASRQLALDRLTFEAHVLRAGGRLLHDLIDVSIRDDLAGIQAARSGEIDPTRGNQLAWGTQKNVDASHNSMQHLMRVVAGRWEADPATVDCGNATDSPLASLMGDDFDARIQDVAPATTSQLAAVRLAERAGVVLDKLPMEASTDTSLRDALKLAMAAQIKRENATSALSALSTGTTALLDGLSGSDLRFAFERNYRTVQLLTNRGTDQNLVSGLALFGFTTHPDFAGGVTIDGGLDRARLRTDVIARTAGLWAAGQCYEPLGDGPLLYADGVYQDHDGVPWEQRAARNILQDTTSLGQAYLRRLTALDGRMALTGNFASGNTAETVARGAMAELSSWAGNGNIVTTVGGAQQPSKSLTFTFSDVDIAAFGAQAPTDGAVAANALFGVAYGPPWVGECATGARTDCPADFQANYTVPLPVTFRTPTSSDRAYRGVSRMIGEATIDMSGPLTHVPDSTQNQFLIYSKSGTNGNHKGRVVGVISAATPVGASAFTPIHTAAIDTLGDTLEKEQKYKSPTLDGSSLAEPPTYCAGGVPKDIFVPLENELTSDSDGFENSWRHYLTLAKAAAQRADDLGTQLIAQGTQTDFRREAAAEQVAELCGGAPNLTNVHFAADGSIEASKGDVVLNDCLSEPTTDFVFFGADQLAALPDDAARYTRARQILQCDGAGKADPLCRKPAGSTFTHASLGLVKDTSGSGGWGSPTMCDPMLPVVSSVATGFDSDGFAKALSLYQFSTDALRASVIDMKIKIDEVGDFVVTSGTTKVMSSSPTDGAAGIWPACAALGTCAFLSHPMVRVFDETFRACPGTTLGTCESGTSAKARAELNAIRWRVQGALWQLGAITGSVPPAMFDGYIPAANFASGAWSTPKEATIPTTYLTELAGSQGGIFTLQPSGYYNLSSPHPDDIKAIGDALSIHTNFTQFGSAFLAAELDPMSADIYQNRNRYLHVHATNKAWQPDYGILLKKYDAEAGSSYFAREETWHHSLPPDLIALLGHDLHDSRCGFGDRTVFDAEMTAKLHFLEVEDYFTSGGADGHITWAADGPGLSVFGDDFTATPFDVRRPYWLEIDGAAAWNKLGPNNYLHALRASGSANTPADRVRLFVNPATDSSCSTVRKLVSALSLGCAAQYTGTSGVITSADRPQLEHIEDLAAFDAWIGSIATSARAQLAQLSLTHIPKRVVDDFVAKSIASGGTKGTHGDRILELESELNNLASAWSQVVGDLEAVRLALRGARIKIEHAKITEKTQLVQLTMQQFQVYAAMASSAASVVSTMGLSTTAIPFEVEQLKLVGDLKSLAADAQANDIADILNTLSTSSSTYWTDLEKSLNGVRSSTARNRELIDQLGRVETKATYEAAKGAGADYVSIDGAIVTLPINAVLRRTYDVTALRYKEALRQAKYLTYLARRAIEQRIGIPLGKLTDPVGALPAPAGWADQLCSLSGIDYQKLKSNLGPSAPISDDKVITSFADQYIGDYVTKLEEFVEYYNVEFPSHEGDDVTVLSLREDLLAGSSTCTGQSPNLLYQSGQLEAAPACESIPVTPKSAGGWRVHPCDSGKCLTVAPSSLLAPATDPPPGVGGGFSWLHETAPVTTSLATPADLVAAPRAMVSQVVHLEPGRYALSWWDQARDSAGALAPAAGTYRAGVFDGSWSSVAGSSYGGAAYDATVLGASAWGTRRVTTFEVKTAGTYYVAFGAGTTTSPSGSLGIGNVQLEKLLGTSVAGPDGSDATAYSATTTSRAVSVPVCSIHSSPELRSAFERHCDTTGCYYELSKPLVIDTSKLGDPSYPLRAHLAAGNFNYRHIGVSLNLVGTGVRDCAATPTPSCYGSGFQEYTLLHDAHDVGILTWHKDRYPFDFGRGHIEHAKALAAERYLTVPFGSTDLGLLTQPGIEKTEFRGRPLDGSYRLRIWDSPSLHWDKVDDVQLILKYHYWSVVDRTVTP